VKVTALKLHRKSRNLEVHFEDGVRFDLALEYLRVFSPSAELRGHGLPEPILAGGKRNVNVARVEPVGNYAVRLVFDDGHDTGLYSWTVLRDLGENHERNWTRYLDRLQQVGMSRDKDLVKLAALVGKYEPTLKKP
jgi:DUF971 family protein